MAEPGVPLPALRSPSCAVNARSWLFMSAIRFGTPTCLHVRVGEIAPEADRVGVPAASFSWPLFPPSRRLPAAIPVVIAAATSAARTGNIQLRIRDIFFCVDDAREATARSRTEWSRPS